jgi:hypothetical protein
MADHGDPHASAVSQHPGAGAGLRRNPWCRHSPAERHIEISATVSEAVADAFEKQKALRRRAPWWY